MGYGTMFTADMYISREDLTNIHNVNDEIDESQKLIADLRERIFMYVANGVNGVCTKDCEGEDLNPNDALHQEVSSLLDQLLEVSDRLSVLLLLKADYDEDTKKFKTAEFG